MNKKEKKILLYYLKELSDRLSTDGCNDVPEDLYNDWTEQEKKEFEDKIKHEDLDELYFIYNDRFVVEYFVDKIKEDLNK
jgi:hypothetical protein